MRAGSAVARFVNPEEEALPEDVLEGLIRIPPFHHYLGIEVKRVEKRRAVLAIPPKEEFIGDPFVPAIHGGIVSALVDLAGGAALFASLKFPTPTIDMRIDFLRPAFAGQPLVADARVKSLGKTVAFVDVDVYGPEKDGSNGDSRVVAQGRCVYSVKDRGIRGFAHPIG